VGGDQDGQVRVGERSKRVEEEPDGVVDEERNTGSSGRLGRVQRSEARIHYDMGDRNRQVDGTGQWDGGTAGLGKGSVCLSQSQR
jgi:hypothetical protein